jgi:hypothetical protein
MVKVFTWESISTPGGIDERTSLRLGEEFDAQDNRRASRAATVIREQAARAAAQVRQGTGPRA